MIDVTVPSQIHKENNTKMTHFSAPRDDNTNDLEKVRTGMTTKPEVDRFQSVEGDVQINGPRR